VSGAGVGAEEPFGKRGRPFCSPPAIYTRDREMPLGNLTVVRAVT
jgi:hypothetical protein